MQPPADREVLVDEKQRHPDTKYDHSPYDPCKHVTNHDLLGFFLIRLLLYQDRSGGVVGYKPTDNFQVHAASTTKLFRSSWFSAGRAVHKSYRPKLATIRS